METGRGEETRGALNSGAPATHLGSAALQVILVDLRG